MDSEPNTDSSTDESPTPQPTPPPTKSEAAEQPAAVSRERQPQLQLTEPVIGWLKVFFSRENSQFQVRVIGVSAAGVLAVACLVWSFVDSSASQSQQEAWGNWVEAGGRIAAGVDPVKAYRPVTDSQNVVVRNWARLKEAEAQLTLGLRLAYEKGNDPGAEKSDRFGKNNEIRIAKSTFETLAEGASDPSLRERALYGVAVSSEALCDGSEKSVTQVIAAYSKLGNKSDFYRPLAEQRVAALRNDDDVQSFYEWFSVIEAKIEEPKAEPTKTGATPGGHPDLLNLDGDAAKTTRTDQDGQTKADKRRVIPDEKKPAEKKPAEKKPAEKKPAEKKPAVKKPAVKKKPAEKKKPAVKKPAVKKKLD